MVFFSLGIYEKGIGLASGAIGGIIVYYLWPEKKKTKKGKHKGFVKAKSYNTIEYQGKSLENSSKYKKYSKSRYKD